MVTQPDDNAVSPGGGGPRLWLLGGPGVPGVAHHDGPGGRWRERGPGEEGGALVL